MANFDKLGETARLNNIGIAHEKAGNTDAAVSAYEENIIIGYPATHSYHRLRIIYRRQKNYKEELRVIDRGLQVYEAAGLLHQVEDWVKRREKVLQLMNKKSSFSGALHIYELYLHYLSNEASIFLKESACSFDLMFSDKEFTVCIVI